MPTEERIKELIELLIRGTSNRTLRWETTVDEDAFRLSFPIANMRLARSEGFDQEANEPFISRSLTVFNDKSRVVEEYSPGWPAEQSRFDELFQLARRSARKTDEILDGLIDQIRDLVEAFESCVQRTRKPLYGGRPGGRPASRRSIIKSSSPQSFAAL